MHQQRYDEIHNYPGTLGNTSQYDVILNTKIIFQNLLLNYFNGLNTDYLKKGLEPQKFWKFDNFQTKARDIPDPIDIRREFPMDKRNYPFIVISIPEFKEKKLYLGWDNIGHAGVHKTKSGMLIGELAEAEHFMGTVQIAIAAKTIDDRDRLVGYCGAGFQNYFRSNYRWVSEDGKSSFMLHAGSEEIEYELDPNAINDGSGGDIFKIYAGNVKINLMLEHYFSTITPDLIDNSRYTIQGTVVQFPLLDENP